MQYVQFNTCADNVIAVFAAFIIVVAPIVVVAVGSQRQTICSCTDPPESICACSRDDMILSVAAYAAHRHMLR